MNPATSKIWMMLVDASQAVIGIRVCTTNDPRGQVLHDQVANCHDYKRLKLQRETGISIIDSRIK